MKCSRTPYCWCKHHAITLVQGAAADLGEPGSHFPHDKEANSGMETGLNKEELWPITAHQWVSLYQTGDCMHVLARLTLYNRKCNVWRTASAWIKHFCSFQAGVALRKNSSDGILNGYWETLNVDFQLGFWESSETKGHPWMWHSHIYISPITPPRTPSMPQLHD